WKLRRNGAFICCSGIARSNKQGLIDGHAYSVMSLRKVSADMISGSFFRLVQIRNPHGGGEWQGAWSDSSRTWSQYPHVKQTLLGDGQGKEDGTFWMQWEDFIQFWKEVQVVDCETTINTIATPVYDEHSPLGPFVACLFGCFHYWFCCLGLQRLYLGRSGAKDVAGMKKDMDNKCGIDQDGCYCTLLEQRALAADGVDEEKGLIQNHH
ncbi:unnamed protein product, partial [Polarella glacialis]